MSQHNAVATIFTVLLASVTSASLASGPEGTAKAIGELKANVEALPARPPDPQHEAEIALLRELAEVLEALPGIPDRVAMAVDELRVNANKLEGSQPQARHSRLVKKALGTAAEGLAELAVRSYGGVKVLASELAQARIAIARIDPSRPFLRQRKVIHLAFRKLVGGLTYADQSDRQVAVEQPGDRQPVAGRDPA